MTPRRLMVEKVTEALSIPIEVLIAFSYFYSGKEVTAVFLKEVITQFLYHDTVTQEMEDFCLDYLSKRCILEFDKNPHNGNLILRVKYRKKM